MLYGWVIILYRLIRCILNKFFLQSLKQKEQPIMLKISYICERLDTQLVPLSTLKNYGNFQVGPTTHSKTEQ